MKVQIHFKTTTVSRVLACAALLITAVQATAQSPNSSPASDTLTVGIAGSDPFIIESEKTSDPEGITIEIWENIADKVNWKYQYKNFDSVGSALDALDSGSVDIVAGPISITAKRLDRMGFSQPYYQSSLSILSRIDDPSLWEKIAPFFSFKLLIAVAMFLFILAIVGFLLWIAERKASPEQFPPGAVKGIGNGMWLAIVTMSTTGYGDMAPVTLKGRVIAGSWMVITLIFATSMIAGIASTLTISSLGSNTITHIEELSQQKVATVQGSPAELFLKEHNSKVVTVTDLDKAIAMLKNREVAAVVYDRPQLRYYLKKNQSENLHLSKAEYYRQGYGFAFPQNSPLIHDVNRALLTLSEDQVTTRIIAFYLGAQK